jgi:hypothetical protein
LLLLTLVVACSSDSEDPDPPNFAGFWNVEVETTVNTCGQGDPGFSWVEAVRLQRQGNYLARQVWNDDIGCPDAGDWATVPLSAFSGDTLRIQGVDEFSPGPGCTARVTWSHTVTFTATTFEGRYVEDLDYEGDDCFGNVDCRVEDVESGTRCDDCWPCPV